MIEEIVYNINKENMYESLEELVKIDGGLYKIFLVFDNAMIVRPRECCEILDVCEMFKKRMNIGDSLWNDIRRYIHSVSPMARSACDWEKYMDMFDVWGIDKVDRRKCNLILNDDVLKYLDDDDMGDIIVDGGLLLCDESKILSPVAFAGLCGSVNIFKYLINNEGFVIDKDVVECGMLSGNREIINIVKDKIVDVERVFKLCVKWYRNEMIDEMLCKIKIRSLELDDYCVKINSWVVDVVINNGLVRPHGLLKDLSEEDIVRPLGNSLALEYIVTRCEQKIIKYGSDIMILDELLRDGLYLRYMLKKSDVVKNVVRKLMIVAPYVFVEDGDLLDVMCECVDVRELTVGVIPILEYAALRKKTYTMDILYSHGCCVDESLECYCFYNSGCDEEKCRICSEYVVCRICEDEEEEEDE